jgi:hypothetical protein
MEDLVMEVFPAPRNQMAPMRMTTSFRRKTGLGMKSEQIPRRAPANYTEVQRVLVEMEEGEGDRQLSHFRKEGSKEQDLRVSWMTRL